MKVLIQSAVIILFTVTIISCSTSEQATERDRDNSAGSGSPYLPITEEIADDFLLEELSEFERLLYETRNSLADESSRLSHEMPEMFTRKAASKEDAMDEFAGYRVQILSTRDVVHADTTRDRFLAWADTTLAGYQPDAYVLFRQPYYRVRAGDFRDRDLAIEFSQMLKQYFPDAWVVHDRIEPYRVPADTADIGIRIPD